MASATVTKFPQAMPKVRIAAMPHHKLGPRAESSADNVHRDHPPDPYVSDR
jgi:hypothetical protein